MEVPTTTEDQLGFTHHRPQSGDFYFDFTDLTANLWKSLKSSGRLRYTCSDVSPNVTPILDAPARYLALGTTSGSVHVFQHFPTIVDSTTTFSAENQQGSVPLTTASSSNSLINDATLLVSHSHSHPFHSTSSTLSSIIHHTLSIIHEELIGSITSVAFAPIQVLVTRQGESTLPTSRGSSDEFEHSLNSPNSSGHGSNGHNQANETSNQPIHQLNNLLLAIGSSKGSLLVVDIDLLSQEQVDITKLSNSSRWQVLYQSNAFTRDAISHLRWDNSNR